MSVAIVVRVFPRFSETFVAQEILGLEKRGLQVHIVSLKPPTDTIIHPVHREIKAGVNQLPRFLLLQPLRLWRAWRNVRRWPEFPTARATFLRDFLREPWPSRLRRFGQAMILADELPGDCTHLYAHFINPPASVARYAAALKGLPWSVSAHAKDIWTTPEWEVREKLADCQWAVTCTEFNRSHLVALAPPGRVNLVYHGLDGSRFPETTNRRMTANGSDPQEPVVVLSVGRAVNKKGYFDLLQALAALPADLQWRFLHIGGGPLLGQLKKYARRLGLAERVQWLGSLPQQEVLRHYRAAALFVLACRVEKDGDRDGLPNVLMEAQSQGLAVISTRVSAIPEFIHDGKTGLLVPERDPTALSAALLKLISQPDLRREFGRSGETLVRRDFRLQAGIDCLAEKFGLEAVFEEG